MYRNFGD